MRIRDFLVLASVLAIVPSAFADRIILVAGGGDVHTDIVAAQAQLREPFGVDFDRAGNLYIVEMEKGNRLLRIDARGILTHVAGLPVAGDGGDGGAPSSAQFRGPHNLAVLPDGRIAIADTWNGRIRAVDLIAGRVTR